MCQLANVPMNEKSERLKLPYVIEGVYIKKARWAFFIYTLLIDLPEYSNG